MHYILLCKIVSAATARSAKSVKNYKSLGEQAVCLRSPHERMLALQRTTSAMQVLLARTMLMKALALLSERYVMQSLKSF